MKFIKENGIEYRACGEISNGVFKCKCEKQKDIPYDCEYRKRFKNKKRESKEK